MWWINSNTRLNNKIKKDYSEASSSVWLYMGTAVLRAKCYHYEKSTMFTILTFEGITHMKQFILRGIYHI